MLSSQQIQDIIPHRPPFLLVDSILELKPGEAAVGIKNVAADEFYFQGHFPGYPVFPGVLIVEALAQVGCVALLSLPQNKGKLAFFAGINAFRFRKPVLPGHALRLEVHVIRARGAVGKAQARASVEGKTVAEGELMFVVAERP